MVNWKEQAGAAFRNPPAVPMATRLRAGLSDLRGFGYRAANALNIATGLAWGIGSFFVCVEGLGIFGGFVAWIFVGAPLAAQLLGDGGVQP